MRYLLLALLLAPFAASAQSDSSSSGPAVLVIFPERQKERRASRWTLADWLTTKKTINAQNFWLAQHTNKVPVDFNLTAGLRSPGTYSVDGELFVTWLGLRAGYAGAASSMASLFPASERGNDPLRSAAHFDVELRLFGGNIQNTNLLLRGSYESETLQAPLALPGRYSGFGVGPELQIYFANWLGLRGDYLYRLPRAEGSTPGQRLAGSSYTAVAFLEMGSYRLEGGYTSRTFRLQDAAGASLAPDQKASGLVSRVRLFF